MTNPLIPVSLRPIGEIAVQAVNARDLHAFLEVGKDFSTWMKVQIERARLQEHRDYETFDDLRSPSGGSAMARPQGDYETFDDLRSPSGGSAMARPQVVIEYALTLDAAKHVAMLAGTDKGFEVREYFIACEREAHDPIHRLLTMPRSEMLSLAAEMAKDNEVLRGKVKTLGQNVQILEPKAAFHDQVAAAGNAFTVAEFAKILGTGEVRMFRWLRQQRYLMDNNLPYQEYLDRGYFIVREGSYRSMGSGEPRAYRKTFVTGKGQTYLAERWRGVA